MQSDALQESNENMPPAKDAFLCYTPYNVFAVILVLVLRFPDAVVDVVRGSTLLVGASVLLVYLVYGYRVVVDYWRRWHPHWPTAMILIYDALIHFLPVLLLGLPRTCRGILIAYVIILIWYLLVRSQIQRIYIRDIEQWRYDAILFGAAPLLVVIISTYIKMKKK
jgi:hypothetical protein